MKKILILISVLIALSACAKTKFSVLDIKNNKEEKKQTFTFNALEFDLTIDDKEANV